MKLPGIGLFNILKNTNAQAPLSPIAKEVKETEVVQPSELANNEAFTSGDEDDDDDEKELQALIAEGEGKLKKKNYQVSYVTGTKSILCKRFMKLKQCSNGDKCEYAHSKKELHFNSP